MFTARRLLNAAFWGDAIERSVSAAAASGLATLGAGQLGVIEADWGTAGSLAAMAAVISLLKSLVAGTAGDAETAGFTTTRR